MVGGPAGLTSFLWSVYFMKIDFSQLGAVVARNYKLGKRADAKEATRERILRATMQIHDEKGVAPTTFADIAARAGVGQATVSRYFPTLVDLVQACGQHVWQEMRPPVPAEAAQVFAGIRGTERRLGKLVEEVDGFYARGALRLDLASRDRDLVPPLDGFLSAVEAGIAALVREAIAPEHATGESFELVNAMMGFRVWQSFHRSGIGAERLSALRVRLLHCALKAARPG
jgi:AcrR family transcriptional regulator